MKLKISILVAILGLFSWSCPQLPTANIEITLDNAPILMIWNTDVEMWCMKASVTFTETGGVGVNADFIKLEFYWLNENTLTMGGLVKTRLFAAAGFRLNAIESVTYNIEDEEGSRSAERLRITIIGTDDNGHEIKESKQAGLDYMD